jgi:iron complex transport system substrate-binding protein
VRAQPDLIMLGNRSMQVATSYPGWNSLKAVRGNQVCTFSERNPMSWCAPARAWPRPRS